ncbi:hypothetical protein GQ600_8084 [Phytophthora cactorum]|nr:hypothetical protein GQ600_8084 [Phytophthora cactorum]
MPSDLLRDTAKTGWHPLEKQTPYEYLMEPYMLLQCKQLPRLYDDPYGPTEGALRAAGTPLGAFFYFAQPTIWDDIADASNAYFVEKIDERVEGQNNKQVARTLKRPTFKPKERLDAELWL